MNAKFQAVILVVHLFVAALALAETRDIRSDGDFCRAHDSASDKALAPYLTPTWETPAKAAAVDNADLRELDQIGHSLNAGYLESISDSLYIRLAAAKSMGMSLEKYVSGLQKAAGFCAGVDRSGKSLQKQADHLTLIPASVEADFNAFGFTTGDADMYMRRLTVAIIEAVRVATLLESLERAQSQASGDEATRLSSLAQAYMRRLLRLQFHYPVLVLSGTYGGGAELQVFVTNQMVHSTSMGPRSLFFSDAKIEEKLGLNPAGEKAAELPAVPMAEDANLAMGGEHFYADLYEAILSRRRSLPQPLINRLKLAVDLSVRESLSSTLLKCQNVSPCAAFSVEPDLAAARLAKATHPEAAAALACQCKVGDQHEWVDGRVNLGLGLVSAAAVVGASAVPIDWLAYLAYALAAADSVASGAGIHDAYINVTRTNLVALMRSGGAVRPIQELLTEEEYDSQRYNAAYNLVTGVIGLAPPGRIIARHGAAKIVDRLRTPETVAQAKLEFTKAASGLPAPDIGAVSYENQNDPRGDISPLSFELRQKYPLLAETFDRSYSRLAPLDPSHRDQLFEVLKKSAREMIASHSSDDLKMLNEGRVRFLMSNSNSVETPRDGQESMP